MTLSSVNFSRSTRELLLAALCALAAVLSFLPVLTADFVWDDNILQEYQLPRLTVADAFRTPENIPQWQSSYYRPLVVLSYLADAKLVAFGLGEPGRDSVQLLDRKRATLPHASTLLFHALATFAVALLAIRCLAHLPEGESGALFAGLVFALHPAHTESVAAISGRSDSLATFFLVLALLLALERRDRRGRLALAASGLAFFCALLSKEVALSGVVLLPLCLWLLPPRDGMEKRLPGGETAVFAVFAALYAGLRAWAASPWGLSSNLGLAEASSQVLRAGSFYLTKLLLPWPHTPFVPELPGTAQTIATSLLAPVLFAVAAFAYRRRGMTLPLLCLAWFALTCAPSLAVPLKLVALTPVAERYLYLPSVGLALAAGGALCAISYKVKRAAVLAAAGILLAAFAATSWHNARIWQNGQALWSYVAAQKIPAEYDTPWLNLGRYHLDRGNYDEAQRCYAKALATQKPSNAWNRVIALNGMGQILFYRGAAAFGNGRWPEALRNYEQAETYMAQADSLGLPTWSNKENLALVRFNAVLSAWNSSRRLDRPRLELAKVNLAEALRLNPGNPALLERLRSFQSTEEMLTREDARIFR